MTSLHYVDTNRRERTKRKKREMVRVRNLREVPGEDSAYEGPSVREALLTMALDISSVSAEYGVVCGVREAFDALEQGIDYFVLGSKAADSLPSDTNNILNA